MSNKYELAYHGFDKDFFGNNINRGDVILMAQGNHLIPMIVEKITDASYIHYYPITEYGYNNLLSKRSGVKGTKISHTSTWASRIIKIDSNLLEKGHKELYTKMMEIF